MMKSWKRIGKKENKVEKQATETTTGNEYGLDCVPAYLWSRDYGWNYPDETHKKVILTNALECKGKIHLLGIMKKWGETGHLEWEVILSGWFIKAVIEAINNNSNEADITCLFNRDFTASRNRVFTKEQVYEHIIKSFDIVEETDEVLKLRFRI